MKMNMYVINDVECGDFSPIFEQKNDIVCGRLFEKNPLKSYQKLLCVGTHNLEDNVIVLFDSPRVVELNSIEVDEHGAE